MFRPPVDDRPRQQLDSEVYDVGIEISEPSSVGFGYEGQTQSLDQFEDESAAHPPIATNAGAADHSPPSPTYHGGAIEPSHGVPNFTCDPLYAVQPPVTILRPSRARRPSPSGQHRRARRRGCNKRTRGSRRSASRDPDDGDPEPVAVRSRRYWQARQGATPAATAASPERRRGK